MMTGTAKIDDGRRGRVWRIVPWAAAALILLLPLAAMRFTDAVNWNAADFAVAGVLLFGACGAFELAARMTGSSAYRIATGVAVMAALTLVWINLAVGIIGSESEPANLIFGAVLAVGLIGAVAARFRPDGMARALVATALAQALVGLIALVAGLGSAGANWPGALVVLTGFFAALWLLAAWLFRKAAREPSPAEAAR